MHNEKLNVLFIHASWPNQFAPLHRYFRETGLAQSFMLVTEQDRSYYQKHDPAFPGGVISYIPDGDMPANSYYYSGIAERNARHAVPILRATESLAHTQPIDIIMAHAILGPPQMLFDEVDIPIVSYVEFPSFRHHRWDLQYPPMEGQRYCDKYEETLNYFAALKSDCVIAPSKYAKAMFPPILQEKIIAQMDAFDPRKLIVNAQGKLPFVKEPGLTYVGFSANALSSEKGLEQFVRVSKRLSELNPNVRYILLGDVKGVSYCYESIFLEQHYGKDSKVTFKDHLFSKYAADPDLYTLTGHLDGPSFSTAIHNVDFFLYPLQFGSANWGIYELLLRGKVVIASNRCFLPEVVTDGENGFLRDYDDIEGWAQLANSIANDPGKYRHIGIKAAEAGESLHIENVAHEYLKIFAEVIAQRKRLGRPG